MGFRCCQDVASTGGSILMITVRTLQPPGQVPSRTAQLTRLLPPTATAWSRSQASVACFTSPSSKLLEAQGTSVSPRAGPVPCLGMDPFWNMPRDLFSITAFLDWWGSWEAPCFSCLELSRETLGFEAWVEQERAGSSGDLLHGNLNHHGCREQVSKVPLPQAAPLHPTPTAKQES